MFIVFRYVAQGKGILQSHELIDEFLKTVKVDGTIEDLNTSPFMKVLQSAEVNILLWIIMSHDYVMFIYLDVKYFFFAFRKL